MNKMNLNNLDEAKLLVSSTETLICQKINQISEVIGHTPINNFLSEIFMQVNLIKQKLHKAQLELQEKYGNQH